MLKKVVLAVVALVIVAAVVVGNSGHADNKYSNDEERTINAIKKNVKSLVRVSSDKELGSGFYVKPNLILTAYHVVQGSVNVDINMYDGKNIKGVVVNYDAKHDLAMIEVKEEGLPVTISTGIEVGENAISYGYPMGEYAAVNKGIISAINNDLQISTAINNGDSGGMLLDSNGDIIGLVKSRLTSIANGEGRTDVYLVGYATSAVDINLFLRRFK